MKHYNVILIGAGQLGSRHLQSLKAVNLPLTIHVTDPSSNSLETARERYDAVTPGKHKHSIVFTADLPQQSSPVDLAIIATSANVRRQVVKQLLRVTQVRHFVLEKLLFQKQEDFSYVEKLLESNGSQAWVNCCMRMMPFYSSLKTKTKGPPLLYRVTGSQYGLVTNAIHYIDHIAYLTNCYDYSVETKYLDPNPIESKRLGFLEFNGILETHFSDGSHGTFVCYPKGNVPIQVEIASENFRCISRESEGKAWVSESANNWQWEEKEARIPFQSEMTTALVEEILTTGKCNLTPYSQSTKLHLPLLNSLLSFLNKHNQKKFNYYPFT